MCSIPRTFIAQVLFILSATLAVATSVRPPTFSDLVAESDFILRGVVTAVRCEEFDSPDGRGVMTLVTLKVERALKGAPGESLTLSVLGGAVGPRVLQIEGVPRFVVGDRQFVFVAGNGRVFCPLVGLGHGRYPIRSDPATGRDYVVRENGRPLRSVDEVARPLAVSAVLMAAAPPSAALGVPEFEARISALASNPALRANEP